MRRRRSRNRSESSSSPGGLGKLPRLILLLLVLLPIGEWGASAIMARLDARSVQVSDKDIARLYDTDQPGQYRQVLQDSPRAMDAVYAPFVEYRLPPRQNRLVSIDANGVRGGVIGASGPRVVVFGGSTTFGHGLSDGDTITAALAAALGREGRPARIENHAAPGLYSTQDRIAFGNMLAVGDKPDIAVFVHGIDDFLRCGKPERSAWSDRLALANQPVGIETVLRQSTLFGLIRRALGLPEPSHPPEFDPACAADAQVEASLARLDANRRLIAAMADAAGVKVVFVQQPVPSYHYDNAKRAVPIDPQAMMPYVPVAKAYARLAELRGGGKLFERGLVWLAELEPDTGNAYIDPIHYSPIFARVIGEALARPVAEWVPQQSGDAAPLAPAGQTGQ